jgi:site-specific recombinase XerD
MCSRIYLRLLPQRFPREAGGSKIDRDIVPRLTKRIVDELKPAEKDIFRWDTGDGALKGFGLRMKPSGAAAFIIQYRNAEGRTKRLAIGKVRTLAPEEARRIAREKLASVSAGGDPSAQRKAARTTITVAELCDEYLEAARNGLVIVGRFKRPKRASTVAIDEGRVSRHIKPLIGVERAEKLTRQAVQRMADAIAQGKTAGTFKTGKRGKAVVKGGVGTAARVVEFLGGVWSWADKRGLVSGQNPTRDVETGRGDPKERVLTPDELVSLGRILQEKQVLRPAAVAAVRLIAITGLRRQEACALRWSEVDFSSSCLRLETSKTGRSTRPISGSALDWLRSLRPENKGNSTKWVFPNRDGNGSADLKKSIAQLFNDAGLSDARSHDLRRTFASVAADEGYSDATIGELLGHARRGVTARHYIRRPDPALIAAADRVSGRISALLNGEEMGIVIPLPSITPSAS